MKPKLCPSCGTHDSLSVSLSVNFDLQWKASRNEFYISSRFDETELPSEPYSDTDCTCGNCGWNGMFKELVKPTRRYLVTAYYDVDDSSDLTASEVAARFSNLLRGALAGDKRGYREELTSVTACLDEET